MEFKEKVLGSGSTTACVHSDGMLKIAYDPQDNDAKYIYLDQASAESLRDFLNEVYPPTSSLKELYADLETARIDGKLAKLTRTSLSESDEPSNAARVHRDAIKARDTFLEAKDKFEKALNQTKD